MIKKIFSNGDHQYRIASIYYKKQNYEQALMELEILLENYPKSSWVEETKFKIIEILYTLNRCPEVTNQYRDFNLEYSKSRFKSEIDFLVASCLEEEGHLQDAYNGFKALEGQYTYPSILKMKLVGLEKRMEKKSDVDELMRYTSEGYCTNLDLLALNHGQTEHVYKCMKDLVPKCSPDWT